MERREFRQAELGTSIGVVRRKHSHDHNKTPITAYLNTHMKLSEAFPSNFLKADDLGGKNITVEIEDVTFEEIGQGRDKENKIIVSFKGKDKKLIANKTNCNTIAKITGSDDTSDWPGHRIILTSREVDFQGTPTLAIRVSLNKPVSTQAQRPPPPSEPEPSDNYGVDGPDIDF